MSRRKSHHSSTLDLFNASTAHGIDPDACQGDVSSHQGEENTPSAAEADAELKSRQRQRRERRRRANAEHPPFSVGSAAPLEEAHQAPVEAFLSVRKLAGRWSVSVATVWRWHSLRLIPSPISLGPGTTKWRLTEIEAYEAGLSKEGGA
jgi:prophage regulatory protein